MPTIAPSGTHMIQYRQTQMKELVSLTDERHSHKKRVGGATGVLLKWAYNSTDGLKCLTTLLDGDIGADQVANTLIDNQQLLAMGELNGQRALLLWALLQVDWDVVASFLHSRESLYGR